MQGDYMYAEQMQSASSSPSSGRFESSLSTQRKLQQSAREKNLLLAEVQSLKQQLRATNKMVGLSEADRMMTWNRLLETNLKSGTLACVFALKTLFAKRMSSFFFRWRLNARLGTLAAEMSASFASMYVSHVNVDNSYAPPPLPPSPLREHQQQHFIGPPPSEQEMDASATLRLLNARRLASPTHHVGLNTESPSSSGKATTKTKSPGSSGNGATPRYLNPTESSGRLTSLGFQVSSAGLMDADSELRLVEHSAARYDETGGGSGSSRGMARREAELYGFSQYDDEQPFSPVREREKRRSKSSALRSGGGGGETSYMAPTASAVKKIVTPSDLAAFKSPPKLSPAGSGTRNRSRSVSPASARRQLDAPPTSSLSPAARARGDEDQGALGTANDGNVNNTSNTSNGSVGSNGKGGAVRKRASPAESAQIRLLTGVGENRRAQSFDHLLRKY